MATMTKMHLLSIPKGTSEEYPYIDERTWRHWMVSDFDGFRRKCVVKVGRRVWLDAEAVAAWLEAHRGLATEGEHE
jgi:hypothetical protein